VVDLVKARAKAKSKKQKAEMTPAEVVVPRPEASPEPETQHSAPSTQHSAKLDKFKQQAGTKREGFVEEVEQLSSESLLELLTFVLAAEHYALDIEHIVEIVTPRPITRVPNAEEGIVGIISLRGTIVTVVDARRKLRHPPSKNGDDPDRRIIVVEKGGETLGFEVDRVLRVVKTDPTAIEPHPVVHAAELHEAIRGVFRHADALTILLDFDKLLA
jgi:purine-binding chemotaxis protein CheW